MNVWLAEEAPSYEPTMTIGIYADDTVAKAAVDKAHGTPLTWRLSREGLWASVEGYYLISEWEVET